jgi:hypothetical protein
MHLFSLKAIPHYQECEWGCCDLGVLKMTNEQNYLLIYRAQKILDLIFLIVKDYVKLNIYFNMPS